MMGLATRSDSLTVTVDWGTATSAITSADPVESRPLPPSALALLAISRWGVVTIASVGPDGEVTDLTTEGRPIDEGQLSYAGHTLAYLVLEGINPADNFIAVVDLSTGRSRAVHPSGGFAIFGFVLSPTGQQLVYLEVSMTGGSQAIPWQVYLVDLVKGEREVVLRGVQTREGQNPAQVPIAWSATRGEIYTRGIVPYQWNVGQGIWAVRPDGSGMRPILSEMDYVELPRLSPDGTRLAYLASEPDYLPRDYLAGPAAPPPNILKVMDLATGQEHIAAHEEGGAYGSFLWAPDAAHFLLRQARWEDGAFQPRAILSLASEGSEPQEGLTLVSEERGTIGPFRPCAGGDLLYVVRGDRGAELRLKRGDEQPSVLFSLPDGDIHFITCWG